MPSQRFSYRLLFRFVASPRSSAVTNSSQKVLDDLEASSPSHALDFFDNLSKAMQDDVWHILLHNRGGSLDTTCGELTFKVYGIYLKLVRYLARLIEEGKLLLVQGDIQLQLAW